MTGNEQNPLINIVAPALRALLAQGHRLRLIRFSDSASDPRSSLQIQLPPEASPQQVVENLATAINASQVLPKTVGIKNLGAFTVVEDCLGTGRVAGMVALVTGAAQGIGLGIAQNLTEQGACVVLADINEQGAKDAADELCRRHGTARAIGVPMDVTNSQSIQSAMNQIIRTYGGLDIFIANAGVLRAGSVKTMSPEDFDFVTAVNYKGYFLCVQKIAPILATQHLAKPDYTSDIIQINSKSGLVGSNRNAAYAGSKFGGIGLTQSFALELISDRIKVNSVCPGNFFDGLLWADPQNGLFAQYLRAGKVPGAKTIEDIRKAYEAKVPMGRGCTPSDVANAIYYVVEQKYETGQALPVTGGQIMLR